MTNILFFIAPPAPSESRKDMGGKVRTIRLELIREILQCVGASRQVCYLCLSLEKVETAGVMSPILFG